MKNIKPFALSILFSLSSCAGASPKESDETNIEITDGIGRQLTVSPGSYRRIVCVGAGALRLYSYLGDMSLLSGVEDIDNPEVRENSTMPFEGVARPYYDANKDVLKGLPSAGTGGPIANQQGPNLAKLISCEPDLIISDFETKEAAEAMEKATGAMVFTIKYGRKAVFDETVHAVLQTLGKLLDRQDRANELLSYIEKETKALQEKTKDVIERPNVYVGGIGNWGQKDYLATHSTYPMFTVANIKNVLSDVTLAVAGQQDISKETFESLAPNIDKMILDGAGMKQTLVAYQADKTIFDNVKAVSQGEVYLQLPYNAYYTNLEVALMNAYFDASSVYPSVFEGFDFEGKCREILSTFNGKDVYDFEKSLPGNYGGYQKIDNFSSWCEEHIGK